MLLSDLRLRAQRVDAEGLMTMILNECRRELEECLDYLGDYWQEDLDIDPADMDKRLEDVDPEVFADERDQVAGRLEEEYLLRCIVGSGKPPLPHPQPEAGSGTE